MEFAKFVKIAYGIIKKLVLAQLSTLNNMLLYKIFLCVRVLGLKYLFTFNACYLDSKKCASYDNSFHNS